MDPRMAAVPRPGVSMSGSPIPGTPLMGCPWGCGVRQCNHNGHCRHLVGFTIDGKTVELRERYQDRFERTGYLLRDVKAGDVFVGQTPERRTKNGTACPTPTQRVYRKDGRAPVLDDGKTYRYRPDGTEHFQFGDQDMDLADDLSEAELEEATKPAA